MGLQAFQVRRGLWTRGAGEGHRRETALCAPNAIQSFNYISFKMLYIKKGKKLMLGDVPTV